MHGMPVPPPTPVTSQQKKLVLTLIVSVTVLDAIIIGLYYGFNVQERPVKTQQMFVATWVVLTLIVVTTMMKRIRVSRRGR